MSESLDCLYQQLLSDDDSLVLAAARTIAAVDRAAACDRLIPFLTSPKRLTRTAAALALRDLADTTTVEPLIAAIKQLQPYEGRETLVYALQTVDCSAHFRFLFSLALNGTYVEQNHALDILFEQEFWYTLDDLTEAQAELDAYAARSDRPADTQLLIDDLAELLDDLREQTE